MVSRPRLFAVTILAATRLEERAVRRELRNARVRIVRSGVGRGGAFDDDVISCGLAGGLRADVPSGTVVVADVIEDSIGKRIACDAGLVAKLADAAKALGFAPLLTSTTLVRNRARDEYAARGFAAADMESGLISAPRVAAVRVILDTPQRELSEGWLRPVSFWYRPQMWAELPWLATTAPKFAHRAAQVVRVMLNGALLRMP